MKQFLSKASMATILAVSVLSAASQSCTDDSESTAAAALVVQADGAAATFAPGSLAVGVTATVSESTAPTEIAALTEAPEASKAFEVKGTKDGAAVTTKTDTPFTLQIDLTVLPTGLAEQEQTSSNLCVVAKSSGSVLLVWRDGAFTFASGKVSFATNYFGVYQIRYCGALTLEGFTEIKAETKTETQTTENASTLGSTSPVPICDMSKAAASMCVEYPLSFATGQVATSLETSCKQGSGTFATSSNCGTTGAVGSCSITQTGENVSISYKYFYYGPNFTSEAALTNCQEDKTESPAEDGETKVWIFTKADGTKVTID